MEFSGRSEDHCIITYVTASNVTTDHNMLIQWFKFPVKPWQKIVINFSKSTGDRLTFQFYHFAPILTQHHYSIRAVK